MREPPEYENVRVHFHYASGRLDYIRILSAGEFYLEERNEHAEWASYRKFERHIRRLLEKYPSVPEKLRKKCEDYLNQAHPDRLLRNMISEIVP